MGPQLRHLSPCALALGRTPLGLSAPVQQYRQVSLGCRNVGSGRLRSHGLGVVDAQAVGRRGLHHYCGLGLVRCLPGRLALRLVHLAHAGQHLLAVAVGVPLLRGLAPLVEVFARHGDRVRRHDELAQLLGVVHHLVDLQRVEGSAAEHRTDLAGRLRVGNAVGSKQLKLAPALALDRPLRLHFRAPALLHLDHVQDHFALGGVEPQALRADAFRFRDGSNSQQKARLPRRVLALEDRPAGADVNVNLVPASEVVQAQSGDLDLGVVCHGSSLLGLG